jgi:hypothetical protein
MAVTQAIVAQVTVPIQKAAIVTPESSGPDVAVDGAEMLEMSAKPHKTGKSAKLGKSDAEEKPEKVATDPVVDRATAIADMERAAAADRYISQERIAAAQKIAENKKPLAEITCPEDYAVTYLDKLETPASWKGFANAAGVRMVATSVGVILGNAKTSVQAKQAPDSYIKVETGFLVLYSGLNNSLDPVEKWAYCAYGPGGYIQLIRSLPDKVSACIASHTINKYGGYDIYMKCT